MSPGFEFVDLGFVGIQTFCKFPFTKDLKDVQIAIVGAPLDQGTFNRPGARYGPRGIREASQMYGSGFIPEQGFFDAELGRYKLAKTKIIDYGDIPVAPTLIEENLEMITDTIKRIVDHGVLPVVLGGDHSITYPVIRAFEGTDLTIVHFDTHMDLADDILGITLSHSNPLKRSSELDHVKGLTQIGIRGLLNPDLYFDEAQTIGVKYLTASEVHKHGTSWALNQIPSSENIYVTFDIDAMDPSVAPGTGTPEPGGFNYLQMREMLTALPKKGKIVGFDVVEVNPMYDPTGITSHVACRLIIDFLAAIREPSTE